MRQKAYVQHLQGRVPITAVILLYGLTFFYVLPTGFNDKLHSYYFDHDPSDPDIVRKVMEQNSYRFGQARNYFNRKLAEVEGYSATQSAGIHRTKNHNKPDITIGIITLQRSIEKERLIHLGYLTQVTAAFHGLSENDKFFGKKNIFICNIDPYGSLYKEANLWYPLVNVTARFNQGRKNSEKSLEPWEKFEKEKQDYQFCLKHATLYGSSAVVLVEDDVVPKENFFKILHKAVAQSKFIAHGESAENENSAMGFIKLYYPERWSGFGNELRHFMEILSFGIAGGILFHILWTIYIVSVLRTSHRRCISLGHILATILGIIYTITLILTIGRPYILRYLGSVWNWHTVIDAKKCCTQAVLYNSKSARDLVAYLDTVECNIDYAVDHAIDQFIDVHKLHGYLIEPNLVTHIGMFSSLRPYGKSAAEFLS